ncbi:MAG TPA: (4Fe-4S)-binding protein, partial [Armatimonadota bacterium]|nr:(4Fe-4S)-binding protein [Armatimonadota bacterium]
MLTSAEVKEWGKRCGADLVGIGAMSRFEGAPTQFDPRYIFPEAKSIIGLGFRVHRGLYRGIEEGTWFAGLPSMGYANINDVYAPMVLREVGNLLEDDGYEAVIYANSSVRYGTGEGSPVREGLPRPDVFLHFRIAAYICGMGEIGWSKVFLTPEFGPRQRFAFIITDAPLEPDPLVKPGTLCDRCKRCVRDCPAGAINAEESVK